MKRAFLPLLFALLGAVLGRAGDPGPAGPLLDALRQDLTLHRRLVVLVAREADLRGPDRERLLAEGHRLHHERRALVARLDEALAELGRQAPAQRDPVAGAVLDWMEKDPGTLDLDRLAFRDPLRVLQKALAHDAGPEGAALKARVAWDLAQVDHVEALAEAEFREARGGPQAPPRPGGRAAWNAYVEALEKLLPPEAAAPPAPPAPAPAEPGPRPAAREITGRELPEKVLILSFDDGPHRVYTEEIKDILRKYQVPAVFFEVGRNLGSVDAQGAVKLGALSSLTEDLVQNGFLVGNHSYTHAQLSKETGAPLQTEIGETDKLLSAIPGAHTQLFRFPYGARTPVQLQALEPYHLRSVLWNIDSLDWADPVPASVAARVLKLVEEEKRGIILFHDIHDRAGKVLPQLLDQLRAKGYRFAGLDRTGALMD